MPTATRAAGRRWGVSVSRPGACHDERVAEDDEVRWLSADEQAAWRAYLRANRELDVALDRDLQAVGVSLPEYELLSMLSELPPGSGVDAASASRAMVWQRPRWSARLQPDPVADLLTEAHAVGVVGRGALASPLRRLLAGEDEQAVIAAMDKALPSPIDHFLVQADLTVIVPGPLERDLAERLGAVATVESAGAAMVYRIDEASVRRAAGFSAHSRKFPGTAGAVSRCSMCPILSRERRGCRSLPRSSAWLPC